MDWFNDTVRVLPMVAWVWGGVGVPYALLALPRKDWQKWALLGALAFVFGTALQTLSAFGLGTVGEWRQEPLLTAEAVGLITLGMAVLGWAFVWRKMRRTPVLAVHRVPFSPIEWGLIACVGLVALSVWWTTAFWTFTAYDTLWVYGYQGRVYALLGRIPAEIGYYPPYLSLQYAFYQLVGGGINDHFARVIVPFFYGVSVLSAYTLGAGVFNRRVGIAMMALWAFYPHVGMWSQMGDLEVPLTLHFTLSSAFFLMAWRTPDRALRVRYALIAGAVFGVAMWTKPTAGAFVWGVVLAVVVEFLRVKGNVRAWLPRFEVAFWTGVACVPLGALWYVRNVLLGHSPVDFPNASWLTLATRSGDLFGWGLLAMSLLVGGLMWRNQSVPVRFALLAGVALIWLGVLPSFPTVSPNRIDAPASYMSALEVSILGVGVIILAWALWRLYRPCADEIRTSAGAIGWAFVLALPYFITWFYAYSYHYRLSFAIVPLLMLPSAFLISHYAYSINWQKGIRWLVPVSGFALIVLVIVPLPIRTSTPEGIPPWELVATYPDDRSKYIKTNGTLMLLVDELNVYQERTGITPVVVAPGEQQLPFFFPLWNMQEDSLPTRLSDLDGATHYLYGTLAGYRYKDAGIPALQNQVVSSLGRSDVLKRTVFHDEGIFRVELYENHSATRFDYPNLGFPFEYTQTVLIEDTLRLLGDTVGNTYLPGSRVPITFYWQVLRPPEVDYWTRLELFDEADGKVYYEWVAPILPTREGHYYSTTLWEVGEIVRDERFIMVDHAAVAGIISSDPPYKIRLSLFVAGDEGMTPVPMTIDGVPATAFVLRPPFYYRAR